VRGFLVVLTLIGLIAGGGYGVRTYAPQYLPNEWTTDEVLSQRLRTEIAEDGRADAFMTKFERLFPADYNEIMAQLVALYRRDGTKEQAATFTESYMTTFLADNKRHVPLAEPAALGELGASIAEATRVMREEDPQACGELVRSGRGFTMQLEDMSPAMQTAFIRVTNAMLDGIASGKTTPTQYAPPTEVQLRGLFSRYEAAGGNMQALQASARDPYMLSMSADEVCLMSERMWVAALQAEDDFLARFVSYSMRAGG
jgi:hypothetical protein